MADLMAKQESKASISLSRYQEVEGRVVYILADEVVFDLGTKAEGVLYKKDLSPEQMNELKVGDKLTLQVVFVENESGQVVLSLNRSNLRQSPNFSKFRRFEDAKNKNETLKGQGVEVNKGGLIVEIGKIRGFLPFSQVSLSAVSNLDDLVGKEIDVNVIEIDPGQNRLILSQKITLGEDAKKSLSQINIQDTVSGEIAQVLPFGVFVKILDKISGQSIDEIYGLVHISEMSWEKVDDPNTLYKIGDKLDAKVLSVDMQIGRINLSIKQLGDDPFSKVSDKLKPNDVVKFKVEKVSPQGIFGKLDEGVEGFIPSSKMEEGVQYKEDQTLSCLIDSIDSQKRRVNLAPFITSTSGLIYK